MLIVSVLTACGQSDPPQSASANADGDSPRSVLGRPVLTRDDGAPTSEAASFVVSGLQLPVTHAGLGSPLVVSEEASWTAFPVAPARGELLAACFVFRGDSATGVATLRSEGMGEAHVELLALDGEPLVRCAVPGIAAEIVGRRDGGLYGLGGMLDAAGAWNERRLFGVSGKGALESTQLRDGVRGEIGDAYLAGGAPLLDGVLLQDLGRGGYTRVDGQLRRSWTAFGWPQYGYAVEGSTLRMYLGAGQIGDRISVASCDLAMDTALSAVAVRCVCEPRHYRLAAAGGVSSSHGALGGPLWLVWASGTSLAGPSAVLGLLDENGSLAGLVGLEGTAGEVLTCSGRAEHEGVAVRREAFVTSRSVWTASWRHGQVADLRCSELPHDSEESRIRACAMGLDGSVLVLRHDSDRVELIRVNVPPDR